MSDHSVFSSLPSQNGPNENEQRSIIPNPIKKAWLAVTTSLGEIWWPLALHACRIACGCEQDLRGFVLHLMLCLIMTILLPISLPWKLIKGKFTLTWKLMLVISCIAMSIDPLFFYIPFVDENNKCIGIDKKLRATVLVLRSLTDFAFLLHIIDQNHDRIELPKKSDSDSDSDSESVYFRRSRVSKYISRRGKWLSEAVIIDFLAILPIPQVTIVIVFSRMRGSGFGYKTAIGNVFLILQLIIRGRQIYHFQKQHKVVGKWAISAFYFLNYIFAGQVLGAFWYFLSIQREISCWHQTCRNVVGCQAIHYCGDTSSSTNITMLNEFCSIHPLNETLFDFGVFLDALQSGSTGPIHFTTKYFYTFWWGIRNLSNFGTNLETSNYLWENCFSILISLVGLLLFLYLMGNVQTYILWESTTKALEDQVKKIDEKYKALETWMSKNEIPEEMKTEVVEIIKQKKIVESNCARGVDHDVDLAFVFNALDGYPYEVLRRQFCKNILRRLSGMGREESIIQRLINILDEEDALNPKIYNKNRHVVREGQKIDKMLIITEGVIVCTNSARANDAEAGSSSMIMHKSRFVKGEVFGENLLTAVMGERNNPVAPRDVKCETKVEAFALTADKLKEIVHKVPIEIGKGGPFDQTYDKNNELARINKEYSKLTAKRSEKLEQQRVTIRAWLSRNGVPEALVMEHIEANNILERNLNAEVDVRFLFSVGLPRDIEYHIKSHICVSTLRKVLVDEDVLRRICMSLEPVILPEDSFVFYPGDLIDRMLIIVEGVITLSGISDYETMKRGDVEREIEKGELIGEALLSWAFPDVSTSKSKPAISNKFVECRKTVEAFVLTKESLESVVAYYRDGNNKFEQLQNGRDHGVADAKGASISTTIGQRLDQLIQLQRDMLQQQATIRDEMGRRLDDQRQRLDEMAASLDKYRGTPPPPAA